MEHRMRSRNSVHCLCGAQMYEDDDSRLYCVSSDVLLFTPASAGQNQFTADPNHSRTCSSDDAGVWDCSEHCPVRMAQLEMFPQRA